MPHYYPLPTLAQDGILLKVGMGCLIGLFNAYSLIPPRDPRLFDPRVGDDKTYITTMGMQQTSVLSMVELPDATGKTGKTESGDLLHLRQGLLLDHSGMEGVSSRIIFA